MDSRTKLRKFLGHVVFNESLNGPKIALNIMNEGQKRFEWQISIFQVASKIRLRIRARALGPIGRALEIVHTGPFYRVYGSAVGVRLMGVKKGLL